MNHLIFCYNILYNYSQGMSALHLQIHEIIVIFIHVA